MQSVEPLGFTDFARARYVALARSAFLLVGDRGLAEDLVQAALTATFQAWDRIAVAEAAEAYTRTTLVRLAQRSSRRRWRGEIPSAAVELASGGSYEPDVAAALDLRARLGALPWNQRAVLVLRFFDDLSEQTTADLLGCSVGTVKSRTSRALARLREEMPDEIGAFHG